MEKDLVLVLALVFSLSACKKAEPPASPAGQAVVPVTIAASVPVAGAKAQAMPPTVAAAGPAPAAAVKREEPSAPSGPAAPPEPPVLPAKVKYLSYTIKDGNSGGVINPGEKITVTPCIRNIGKGAGRGLSVNISADTLVPALDELSLWPVQPGETKCFPVGFWVPSKAGGDYAVGFAFSDGTKQKISLTVTARPKTEKENTVSTEKDRIKEKMQKAMDDLN